MASVGARWEKVRKAQGPARTGAGGRGRGAPPPGPGKRGPGGRRPEASPSPSFSEPPRRHRCPKRPPAGLTKPCVLEKKDCAQAQPWSPHRPRRCPAGGGAGGGGVQSGPPRSGPEVDRGPKRDLVGTEEALGNRGCLGTQGGSASALPGLATVPSPSLSFPVCTQVAIRTYSGSQ